MYQPLPRISLCVCENSYLIFYGAKEKICPGMFQSWDLLVLRAYMPRNVCSGWHNEELRKMQKKREQVRKRIERRIKKHGIIISVVSIFLNSQIFTLGLLAMFSLLMASSLTELRKYPLASYPCSFWVRYFVVSFAPKLISTLTTDNWCCCCFSAVSTCPRIARGATSTPALLLLGSFPLLLLVQLLPNQLQLLFPLLILLVLFLL